LVFRIVHVAPPGLQKAISGEFGKISMTVQSSIGSVGLDDRKAFEGGFTTTLTGTLRSNTDSDWDINCRREVSLSFGMGLKRETEEDG